MTAAAPLPSVLFVTSELVGPFKNGGLGTATTGLVETVAAMGCPTTVFYTGGIWLETDLSRWVEAYRQIGVTFVPIGPGDTLHLAGPVRERSITVPYLVWEFVRRHRFDVIHFNDCLGEGMLVLAAKQLGLGWSETLLALAHHGPTRWAFGLNRQPMDRILYAAFDWAEQVSVRSADLLWGPSRYLIDATRAEGWQLPAQVLLQQYVMPTARLFEPGGEKLVAADAPPPVRTIGRIEEIAFFGRLEERKGLRSFCAALDRLGPELAEAGIAVTFMGRPMVEDGESTDDWIGRAAAAWPFRWRLETGFGQPEAIAYLTSRPLVAVMPSPFDNSPCTVYEAMQFGIPFLAAATGGIPELVDDRDHATVLFEYTVDGLVGALRRVIRDGITTARPRFEAAERRRQWQEFHTFWRDRLPVAPAAAAAKLGFVVMVDRATDRAQAIRTLDSVAAVLGPRIVRSIVIGQRDLGPLPGDPVRLDPWHGSAPSARLDEILAGTPASWIVCLNAGVTLVADALPWLERALASPAIEAGLIPAGVIRRTQGDLVVPPVGGAQAFGYFEGYGFTGAAVLSVSAVRAVLAGAPPLPRTAFAGLADLLATSGAMLWPVAEVVVDLSAAPSPTAVGFDPTRDALFAGIEPKQASLIRWIGAAVYRDPAAGMSRDEALAAFVAGRRGARLLLWLYGTSHAIYWTLRSRGVVRGTAEIVYRSIRLGRLRRMIWYAVHPIYIIRLFDRWPGYAALRQIYRRARGRADPPAGPG